jgi:hypothetical protein
MQLRSDDLLSHTIHDTESQNWKEASPDRRTTTFADGT